MPTPPPNTITFNGIEYTSIDRSKLGSFNYVYFDAKKERVIKFPKVYLSDDPDPDFENFDHPERAVRLWNEINPDNPAEKVTIKIEGNAIQATSYPYFEGDEPSDEEISNAIIDIFQKTGRVIIDAYSKGNFIKKSDGQIVCIDVNLALKSEWSYQEARSNPISAFQYRSKLVDFEALDPKQYQTKIEKLEKEIKELENTYPQPDEKQQQNINKKKENLATTRQTLDKVLVYQQTTKTLKALLYLQNYRPDVTQVKALFKDKPKLVEKLANAFDEIQKTSHQDNSFFKVKETSPNLFLDDIPVDLEHLKMTLEVYCTRYINSRGSFNTNEFSPNLKTKIVLDGVKTLSKVNRMEELRNKINSAKSIDEIGGFLNQARLETKFMEEGRIFSGVKDCIQCCTIALNIAIENSKTLTPEEIIDSYRKKNI